MLHRICRRDKNASTCQRRVLLIPLAYGILLCTCAWLHIITGLYGKEVNIETAANVRDARSYSTAQPDMDAACHGIRNRSQYDSAHMAQFGTSTSQKFVEVSPSVYAYSAYLDRRVDPVAIRILLLADKKTDVLCIVYHNELMRNQSIKIVAKWYEVSERHQATFGTFVVSCPLPRFMKQWCYSNITTVQLYLSETNVSPVSLQVLHMANEQERYTFSICYPPLYRGRYSAQNLIEIFELNRLLGVDHVTMHVYPNVDYRSMQVLQSYAANKFLSLRYWNLPVRPFDVWYYGQLLAIHDCLYSMLNTSAYVAFQDLDEFIIPLQGNTWQDIVHRQWGRSTAALQFSSVYLNNDDTGSDQLFIGRRESSYHNFTNSKLTKCLVDPLTIWSMGVHHVSQLLNSSKEVQRVPPEIAVVIHHRQCHACDTTNSEIVEAAWLNRNVQMLRKRVITKALALNITISRKRPK